MNRHDVKFAIEVRTATGWMRGAGRFDHETAAKKAAFIKVVSTCDVRVIRVVEPRWRAAA